MHQHCGSQPPSTPPTCRRQSSQWRGRFPFRDRCLVALWANESLYASASHRSVHPAFLRRKGQGAFPRFLVLAEASCNAWLPCRVFQCKLCFLPNIGAHLTHRTREGHGYGLPSLAARGRDETCVLGRYATSRYRPLGFPSLFGRSTRIYCCLGELVAFSGTLKRALNQRG